MTKDELNPTLRACYDKYCIFSEGQDAISLRYLASAMSLTEGQVIRQLNFLIANRFFPAGAYINYSTRMLVLKSSADSAPKREKSSATASERPVGAAEKVAPRKGKSSAAARGDKPDKYWRPKKSGAALLLIGGVICILIGILYLQGEVDELAKVNFASFGINSVWQFLKSAAWFGLGAFQLVRRRIIRTREARLMRYRGIIEGESRVSVKEMSKLMEVSEDKVYGDLRILIDRGLLPTYARVDRAAGELCLTKGETPKTEEGERREEHGGARSQYYEIICEIRRLNEEIIDVPVSQKIDEIESITAKIFRAVEDEPDKEPQIKSFMSYYLPTTLKLLGTYATLEKQGVNGENIDAAKKDIENILDTLIKGFTQQLDKLFEDDVIDISTDIEVLETMMKKDDLFGEKGIK